MLGQQSQLAMRHDLRTPNQDFTAHSVIQPRLEVGAVDDPLEHEADRVDQVMRMADPDFPMAPVPPHVARECATCEAKEEARKLQAKPLRPSEPGPGVAPPVVHEVPRSPGRPADTQTRVFFEPRLGADFSRVRIRTDDGPAVAARAASAIAYTFGRDIVLGAGRYSPGARWGRRLLVHGLTLALQGPAQRRPRTVGIDALQRNGDGSNPSRQSKPTDAPRGTRPIDQTDLDRETIHKIKDGIGAGPRDWVGVTPDGDIITSDADGHAIDNGKVEDYQRTTTESDSRIPTWLAALVGAAVVVAIIACFATGVCEFGAVVGGLGAAAAAAVIALLRSAGVQDAGASPTASAGAAPTDEEPSQDEAT
jgi:hypothetical protein